jgi:hypothetical protein
MAGKRGFHLMDWSQIKEAICAGRDFTVLDHECRVLSDVTMPSGGVVHVHIQPRHGELFLHDGGAAFDELAMNAVEVRSLRGVRAMLKRDDIVMAEDGRIWCERLPLEKVAVGIAVVADASLRAAAYMMARGFVAKSSPLDTRVRDALHRRYPQGRPKFAFEGKNRQHVFDFGAQDDDRIVLIDAVTPEPSSINSAIVKAIDARQANSNVVSLFVFDPEDDWPSASLSMLQLGGRSVELSSIANGPNLLAA